MPIQHILLIGGGGHCKSCIDVIGQEGVWQIAGVIDQPDKVGQSILGHSVIGTDDDLPRLRNQYENALITVGQIKSPITRIKLYDHLKRLGYQLPTIISPRAYVSPHATIGEGTIILHDALINASATVGKNCIINTKALIEHDAIIGDHCHISTGSIINGGTKVGSHSFFGSNSMVKEYIEIRADSVIGGGRTLLQSP